MIVNNIANFCTGFIPTLLHPVFDVWITIPTSLNIYIITLKLVYVKKNTLIFAYHVNMRGLGENLKLLRKINNISQKEFAQKMNTSQQRVSEWECNKVEPSLFNIIKILEFYDITFEELMDGVTLD